MSRERFEVRYTATGAVHFDLPEDPDGSLILAVHGYGQPLADLPAFARAAAPRAAVVAPEGPSSFYRRPRRSADGVTAVAHGWIARLPRDRDDRRNDACLLAALDGVRRRMRVDPERTFLLGFSQGVGVATHLLLSRPELARGVIGLAGGLAAAYREHLVRLRGKDVLWVTGADDEAYPAAYNEALLQAFQDADVAADARVVASGHDVREPALPLVRQWLASRP